ncbi:chitobiase/beta-hexosaminidase domain-containing protein, putative [Bodo saltans]|uniref:Chitobiase/beta-hexosaminidase domain-containing protein, putative n=1 Tax=Bodo saltans TaxID=75058 RepID=A0A0S4JHY9_BODSA|nr:chitobiase/beta-hexosaminidase domain-containing protein, putative [Bodo saltans]|eukprot:CUG91105.1 chitobiase/beta-hexosaminidase domain-containing protein, putative [Bodo saltans]
MFVGDRLVGGIARRTYDIAQARLDPPLITPESGSYVVPLRITMSSQDMDDVRYTLDGSEPSLNSSKFKGPVVLLQEGDVVLKARSFPTTSSTNRRPSETVFAEYILSYTAGDTTNDESSHRHPVTVLNVTNVEFDEVEERMAGETAEKAVAMSRATDQVRREVEEDNASLRKQLSEGKREHKGLLAQLDAIRKELGIAAARKSLLQSNIATQDEATTRTKATLQRLHEEQLELKQQLFSSTVEVGEAERLLRQSSAERVALHNQLATLRKGLEEAYIENKKELARVEPDLEDTVAECSGVLAEQRHELWLLKETISSLHRSLEAPSRTASEFMPQGKAVNLSTVEVSIPIPRGKLRMITGTSGTGLHALRTTHKVQAQIVQDDGELCVRVCGHANGVHHLIEQIGKLLNE